MGDWKKGVAYTGLGAIAGAIGYTVGKYKYMGRKISMGLVGLTLVLYAPKGCELAGKYLETNADVQKTKMMYESKKDSLDAVVRSEEVRNKPKVDPEKVFQELSKNKQELEQQYAQMISANEKKYQELIQKNDAQYNNVLSNIKEQNNGLKKKLEELSAEKILKNSTRVISLENAAITKPLSKYHPPKNRLGRTYVVRR